MNNFFQLCAALVVGVGLAALWLKTGTVEAESALSVAQRGNPYDCVAADDFLACLIRRSEHHAVMAEKDSPGDPSFVVPPDVGTTIYINQH